MSFEYSFLVLSLLFLLPGAAIVLLRADLRPLLGLTAALSLPFAATEFLFYPTYWEPRTLFNLVERVGFGIEDVLFVVGLGLITSGIYPAVFRKRILRQKSESLGRMVLRAALLLAATAAAVVAAVLLDVHMIYAAPVIMLVAAAFIVVRRIDLFVPSLLGGALTVTVYTGLSLVFELLIPGVFAMDWNTEAFLNRYVLGVPVEELLYGFASGLVGSVVGMYLLRARFV